MRLAALALIALLCAGWTTHVIKDRPGGEVISHIAEFKGWEDHHDRVVISGECASACTMLLGIVTTDHVCATSRGSFGFHSASLISFEGGGIDISYSQDGTQLLWFFYGPRVRDALAKAGWPEPSEHPDIISIKATDLVARCK